MKRNDLLHTLLGRLRDTATRESLAVEPHGAEIVGPGEYLVTVYGRPAQVAQLAAALEGDEQLREPRLVEEVGETNRRLHESADAGRSRHLHLALSAPSLW